METGNELAPNRCYYCGEISGKTRLSGPHLAKHRRDGDEFCATVEIEEDIGFPGIWRYKLVTAWGWIAGSAMTDSCKPSSKAAAFDSKEEAMSHAARYGAYLDGGECNDKTTELRPVKTNANSRPPADPSVENLVTALTKFLPSGSVDIKHVGRIAAWAEDTQTLIKAVTR